MRAFLFVDISLSDNFPSITPCQMKAKEIMMHGAESNALANCSQFSAYQKIDLSIQRTEGKSQ